MPGRIAPLTPAALLLSLLVLLVVSGQAQAHRLEAEYRVLPDQKVQVESWFDLTGDSPKGALVQVFRADGQLLTEGRLNDQGVFVFALAGIERLQVVVSAGEGHRKELVITAEELARRLVCIYVTGLLPGDSPVLPALVVLLITDPNAAFSPVVPRADRSSRVSVVNVLVGIGSLLAVAVALGLRQTRQRRERGKRETAKQPQC
jgi:hypothetical protein